MKNKGNNVYIIHFNYILAAIVGLLILSLFSSKINLLTLALCCYLIWECPLDLGLDILYLILPFSTIFKLSLEGGFALINLVIMVLVIKLVMHNQYALRSPDCFTLIFLFLYLFCGLVRADAADCIRMVAQLAMAFLLLSIPHVWMLVDSKRKNRMLEIGLIVSSSLAKLSAYFPRLKSFLGSYSTIKIETGKYYSRFMGLEENANLYTLLVTISVCVFCCYLIANKVDTLDWILTVGVCIYGIMTVSMSFILSLVVIIGLTVYEMTLNNRKLLMKLVPVLVIGGIVVIFCLGQTEAVQTILFRINKSTSETANASSITSGRSRIWLQYIDYLRSHPLALIFGRGLGKSVDVIGRASHNYYLETLYYLGLLGGSLYTASLFCTFAPSRYCRKKKGTLYLQMPLVILLFRGLAINLIRSEKVVFIFLLYTMVFVELNRIKKGPMRPRRKPRQGPNQYHKRKRR